VKGQTSRWLRSEVTFGPVGRLMWTIILFVPIVYAIFYNFFFIVAAALWAMVLPLALRDVWRRVKNPDYEAPIALPPETPELKPGESLHDRKMPRRW
jgi:hypothetical protein